jgi:TonB-dependent starch-binding outer membrane protein SusC
MQPLKSSVVILLISFLVLPLRAQDTVGTVSGIVRDAATGEPIPQVNVVIEGTSIGVASDSLGRFAIGGIPAGQINLIFSHIGYVPATYLHILASGAHDRFDVELFERPILIDDVEVIDTIAGRFDPREPMGILIGGDEIRAVGSRTFGDVIRTFIPRSRVVEEGGNLHIRLQLRRTIAERYELSSANPLVILDGMQLGNSPVGLANIINPNDIRDVRVIRPPEAEVLYGSAARHGAIIIETRELSNEAIGMSPLVRRIVTLSFVSLILYLILR